MKKKKTKTISSQEFFFFALLGAFFTVAVTFIVLPEELVAGLLSAENANRPSGGYGPSSNRPSSGYGNTTSPSSGRPGGQYNTGSTNTTRPASNSGSYSSGSLSNYGNSNNSRPTAGGTVLSGGSANTGRPVSNSPTTYSNPLSGNNSGFLNQTISLLNAFNPFISSSAYGRSFVDANGDLIAQGFLTPAPISAVNPAPIPNARPLTVIYDDKHDNGYAANNPTAFDRDNIIGNPRTIAVNKNVSATGYVTLYTDANGNSQYGYTDIGGGRPSLNATLRIQRDIAIQAAADATTGVENARRVEGALSLLTMLQNDSRVNQILNSDRYITAQNGAQTPTTRGFTLAGTPSGGVGGGGWGPPVTVTDPFTGAQVPLSVVSVVRQQTPRSIPAAASAPYAIPPGFTTARTAEARAFQVTFNDGGRATVATVEVVTPVIHRTTNLPSLGTLGGVGTGSTPPIAPTTVVASLTDANGNPLDPQHTREYVRSEIYGAFRALNTASQATLESQGYTVGRSNVDNFIYIVRNTTDPNRPSGAIAQNTVELITGSADPESAAEPQELAREEARLYAELDAAAASPTAASTGYVVTRDEDNVVHIRPAPAGTPGTDTFGNAMRDAVYQQIVYFVSVYRLQNRVGSEVNSTSNTPQNTPTFNTYKPRPLCSLEVGPPAISAGQSVVLRWSGSNTASVRITDSASGAVIVGSATGSKTLSPQTTSVYTGVFAGESGQSATCVARVIVM